MKRWFQVIPAKKVGISCNCLGCIAGKWIRFYSDGTRTLYVIK